MSMVLEQHQFLQDVIELLKFSYNQGFIVTGGELHRTKEQQEIYVREGKSKTMNSQHLNRTAIDLFFFKKDAAGKLVQATAKEMEPVGKFWEQLSPKNRWGGNFDRDWTKKDNFLDAPHFERKI